MYPEISSTSGYIKPTEDVDPLESLKGKIVTGQLNTGKKFISRLIKVQDGKLFFETKNGTIIMNDLRKVVMLKEYRPEYRPREEAV